MLRFHLFAFLIASSVWSGVAASARADQVNVFAAASLQEVLTDVVTAFEVQTGHQVTLSFAGSSALARQIEYGAPADVVMLANVNWMTYLRTKGFLENFSINSMFGNALTVVVPVNTRPNATEPDISQLLKILKSGRVAMALVEAVPAGIYGKEALTSLGMWEDVQPIVVQTDNVRAALALVALGEVGAGLVYVTDALVEDNVQILMELPAESHSEIVYPAAIVAGQVRPEVVEFMSFLESEVARSAFASRGFLVREVAQ